MRILVVEDEPRLGRALQRGLTAEGYRVDLATDGIDGSPGWVLPLGWSHAMLILAARPELSLVRDGA